jgi:hypothetical protein
LTTSLRRFLVFQLFLLWQGGFLFYTAVVVPIGTEVLGSPLVQGLVTRRVTDWLNLFGAVWALVLAWDVVACRDPDRRRRLARWLGWAGCVLLLGALAWLHAEMDALIDLEEEKLRDRRTFRNIHIGYLWVSTAHWALGLALAWMTLRAWRAEDGVPSSRVPGSKSEP